MTTNADFAYKALVDQLASAKLAPPKAWFTSVSPELKKSVRTITGSPIDAKFWDSPDMAGTITVAKPLIEAAQKVFEATGIEIKAEWLNKEGSLTPATFQKALYYFMLKVASTPELKAAIKKTEKYRLGIANMKAQYNAAFKNYVLSEEADLKLLLADWKRWGFKGSLDQFKAALKVAQTAHPVSKKDLNVASIREDAKLEASIEAARKIVATFEGMEEPQRTVMLALPIYTEAKALLANEDQE